MSVEKRLLWQDRIKDYRVTKLSAPSWCEQNQVSTRCNVSLPLNVTRRVLERFFSSIIRHFSLHSLDTLLERTKNPWRTNRCILRILIQC